MYRRNLPLLLIFALGASACAGSTQVESGALVILSSDGRMTLTVSEAALEGVDVEPDQIEIAKIPVEPLPKGSTAQPFDHAYALRPDGLELSAPAELQLKVKPHEVVTALHISGDADGPPTIEGLEFRDPSLGDGATPTPAPTSAKSSAASRTLVAAIDHFSEVPIISTPGASFSLQRIDPSTVPLQTKVGGNVAAVYEVHRQPKPPYEYYWPIDPRQTTASRHKVTLEIVPSSPWTASVTVDAWPPLTPNHHSLAGSASGNVMPLTEAVFTCDKQGESLISGKVLLTESTFKVTIQEVGRGGKPIGSPVVSQKSLGSYADGIEFDYYLPDDSFGVNCVAESELGLQNYVHVDVPGSKFEVEFTINYNNGNACGATPEYSYPHVLKVDGLELELRQFGHGNATDVFRGDIDQHGDFKLEIVPRSQYEAEYDGHLKQDGSASGTYEFTYPNDCTVIYDFRWKAWVANMLREAGIK